MEHTEWFSKITTGDSTNEAARRSGVPTRTLAHQLNAGALKPENIIKIAEAYEESPVYALVDLGFISARWVNEPGIVTALSRASDEQLTDELLRRLRLIDDTPVDELAQRRRAETTPDFPETAFDDQAENYAADGSETEPEMGDDNYNDGP